MENAKIIIKMWNLREFYFYFKTIGEGGCAFLGVIAFLWVFCANIVKVIWVARTPPPPQLS
jgi:hypothetical protein